MKKYSNLSFGMGRAIRSLVWASALVATVFIAAPSQAQTLDVYNPNPNDVVYTAVTIPGNQILIGGSFFKVGTSSNVARFVRLFAGNYASWTADLVASGAWDRTFAAYANQFVFTGYTEDYVDQIGYHQNFGVTAAGTFNSIGGAGKVRVARLTTRGYAQPFLPPSMQNGGFVTPPPYISQLRGGDILIWGVFDGGASQPPSSYGVSRSGILRWNMFNNLNNIGLLDPNFDARLRNGGSAKAFVNCLAIQDDGKILISGSFNRSQSGPEVANNGFIRLNSDSTLDATFTPSFGGLNGIVVMPNQKILVNTGPQILVLNSNGTIDLTFNSVTVTAGTFGIQSMALRADGKILIGGGFTELNGIARTGAALINSDGSLAPFAPVIPTGVVYGTAIQDNGNMILTGTFTTVNSSTRNHIARFTPEVVATSSVTVDPEGTFIIWNRGGSAPELHNVDFEVSTNGLNYTSLGLGSSVVGGWGKSGLSTTALPDDVVFYLRLSGNTSSGLGNRSDGLVETKAAFLRPKPRILTQPLSLTRDEGDNATFTVVPSAVLPTAPAGTTVLPYTTPTYQWRKGTVPLVNGGSISGAQTDTLTITGLVPGDAGSYNVVITNSAGSTTSASATLKVVVIPVISVDPINQNIGLNKPVSFSVLLSQGTTPTYQWKFNGSTTMPAGVTGATTSKLTIAKALLIHEGQFSVVVTNTAGSDTSTDATLNVIDVLPAIVPTTNQLVAVGTAAVTFNPGITSEVTPTNVWLKNAKTIVGATNPTYVIATAAVTDAGGYQLKATNPLGSTTSAIMQLGVVDTANRRVMGKLNTSTVIAPPIGGNGLTYKWFKVGVVPPLTDGLDYAGTATAKLTVKTTTAADEGKYYCEVTLPGAAAPLNTGEYDLYVASIPVFTLPATVPPGGDVSDATYSYAFADFDTNPNLTPTSFSATGLPPGLTMNKTTGVISGRPTSAKTWPIRITLSNIAGSVTSPLNAYSIVITSLPDTIVGSYVGLVDRVGNSTVPVTVPSTAVGPLHALGARLDLTTLPTGIFSGKVTIGGIAYSFKDVILDNSVSPAHGTVLAISRGTGKPTLKLEFDLDSTTNLLTGTLTENSLGAVPAGITGWRNSWKATGTAPLNPATTRAGATHNFKAVDPGMVADATLPEGASYGTVSVTTAGITTINNGRTADGAVVLTSGLLGPSGQVLVYQSLYAGTGSFAGTLSISDATIAHKLTGSLTWSKNQQTTGRRYKAGWASPINLTASGGLYKAVTATTSSTTIMGLTTLPPKPTVVTNARLDFEGGGVGGNPPAPATANSATDPEVVFQVFSLATPVMPSASVKLSLLTNSSGVFSGSFILSDSAAPVITRTIAYYGLIIPDADTVDEFDGQGVGYYICNGLSPTVTTSTERSGLVTFKKDP